MKSIEPEWVPDEEESGEPDELDELAQEAWARYQAEEGKIAEDEEEFGEPNASYCQSMEPGHNGGWFCYHPDEAERLESSVARWQESQADQDYWQQHQAPWQDHAPTCNCLACCGEEF